MLEPIYTPSRPKTYVVRCKKAVPGIAVGLGDQERWRKGDLLTYEGCATRSLDEAFVYGRDEDSEFPFEDILGNGFCLEDYFEAVPVKVVTTVDWA